MAKHIKVKVDTELGLILKGNTPAELEQLKHKFKLWASQIEAVQKILADEHGASSSMPVPPSKPLQKSFWDRLN